MTAVQGVDFWTLLTAVGTLLKAATGLDDRHVRMWFGDSRPHNQGSDVFVWFRPVLDTPDDSPGPVQYGNKVECKFEIHLVTRNFADQSQIDVRRAQIYYTYYWQIVLTFQNRNIFPAYNAPIPGPWTQPVPVGDNPPYSVGTMLLKSLPVPTKTQREEGVIESRMELTIPTVLALTVP